MTDESVMDTVPEGDDFGSLTCFVSCFSPFSMPRTRNVVFYAVFEFGQKVTSLAFNISFPLLINSLGDAAFGAGTGKLIWTYLTVIASVSTALIFLTCTTIMEYGLIRRKSLIRSSLGTCICLFFTILCFTGEAIYFAIILAFGAKICQSIAQLAHDSLLDAASSGEDRHQVNTRSYASGYIGMILCMLFITIVYALFYFAFGVKQELWVQGIIPLMCFGIWYLTFSVLTSQGLSPELGKGYDPDFLVWEEDTTTTSSSSSEKKESLFKSVSLQKEGSDNDKGETGESAISIKMDGDEDASSTKTTTIRTQHISFCDLVKRSFYKSLTMQKYTIKSLYYFPDVCYLIVAMIFLSGAANTTYAVGVIIAVTIWDLKIYFLIALTIVGIFSAIGGLIVYKQVLTCLSPKHVLLLNIAIVGAAIIYLPFMTHPNELFVVAVIAGSQVGSVGSLQKSILSSLTPTARQSSIFSFFQFSQDATGWIGPLIIASLTISQQQQGVSQDHAYVLSAVYVTSIQILIGIPVLCLLNVERGLKQREVADISDKLRDWTRGEALITECDEGNGNDIEKSLITNDQLSEGLLHDGYLKSGEDGVKATSSNKESVDNYDDDVSLRTL